MTRLNTFRFLSILFIAVSTVSGSAHLYELPNKINLSRESYRVVQQIYRGWALLGIANVGALLSTFVLAVMVRTHQVLFYLTLTALMCIVLNLVVFFLFTYPANQQTLN